MQELKANETIIKSGHKELEKTLYGPYIAERANGRILESEDGFIVYRFDGRDCYIIEMYVRPDRRKSGKGRQLIERLEEIAIQIGAERVTAGIYIEDQRSKETLIASLISGFKVLSANAGILFIAKELPKRKAAPLMVSEDVSLVDFDLAEHGAILHGWFEKRSFPAPDPNYFPGVGVVALFQGVPVAAGFAYRTDAKLAIIGHLVTDPDASGDKRNAALDAVIQTLTRIAQAEGYELVSCATDLPKLMDRFERLGFSKTDEGVSHFRRNLLCQ
jgi:hypothetical protein